MPLINHLNLEQKSGLKRMTMHVELLAQIVK